MALSDIIMIGGRKGVSRAHYGLGLCCFENAVWHSCFRYKEQVQLYILITFKLRIETFKFTYCSIPRRKALKTHLLLVVLP